MNEHILRGWLDGHALPHDSPYCGSCFHALGAGARVVVVARRCYGTTDWEINTLYCPECAPSTVPETPHGSSAMAAADLGDIVDTGRQTHRAALINIEIEETVFGEPEELPA